MTVRGAMWGTSDPTHRIEKVIAVGASSTAGVG